MSKLLGKYLTLSNHLSISVILPRDKAMLTYYPPSGTKGAPLRTKIGRGDSNLTYLPLQVGRYTNNSMKTIIILTSNSLQYGLTKANKIHWKNVSVNLRFEHVTLLLFPKNCACCKLFPQAGDANRWKPADEEEEDDQNNPWKDLADDEDDDESGESIYDPFTQPPTGAEVENLSAYE